MKAIVNVSKNSSFARLNGHTFDVVDFIPNSHNDNAVFGLKIGNNTTDFSSKEIMIVDFASEYTKAEDNHNWYGGNDTKIFRSLEGYAKTNNIETNL